MSHISSPDCYYQPGTYNPHQPRKADVTFGCLQRIWLVASYNPHQPRKADVTSGISDRLNRINPYNPHQPRKADVTQGRLVDELNKRLLTTLINPKRLMSHSFLGWFWVQVNLTTLINPERLMSLPIVGMVDDCRLTTLISPERLMSPELSTTLIQQAFHPWRSRTCSLADKFISSE